MIRFNHIPYSIIATIHSYMHLTVYGLRLFEELRVRKGSKSGNLGANLVEFVV